MSVATSRLVRPAVVYRESYLAAVREHRAEGRFFDPRYGGRDTAVLERDFARFVRDLLDRERPPYPFGRVPEAFYWLVDDDEYVGQSSYRAFTDDDPGLREAGHIGYDVRPSRRGQGYGNAILGAMLAEMRVRCVPHVYVNCDEDNEPSRRVIEHWGGRYEESIAVPGRPVRRRRYRIVLS